MDRSLLPLLLSGFLASCSTSPGTPLDASVADVPPGPTWCSVGRTVPQGRLPSGYCVKLFAGSADGSVAHSPVMEPRVMAFAPDGDLFVSAPSMGTPGGAFGGPGAILVLTDDDADGVAEVHTFLSGVADVHGLAFAPDALYYTTTNALYRVTYAAGQRAMSGTPMQVSAIPNPGRWTHGLARSVGGVMHVSNGVLAAACPARDVGYVASVTSGAPSMMAVGLRNPMYMRCHFRDELCMAAEMGDDGGGSYGAREKLFRIRAGTDYGFPCCAGPDLPAPGATSCAGITQEEVVIPIGNSPFGFDWERGVWPGAMNGVLCIAQHGSFYSTPPWLGEGVYCTPTDPTTHVPTANFTMFLGGFSPANAGTARMLRPADVAFAPDGRMFIADDVANAIYWVAPESLARP
jgi:glucose/arabinose dehydrogenase